MNAGVRIILLLVAMMTPVLAIGAENPWEKKLPFQQATITYELSGMETGEEILYIRKYGEETASYRTTSTSMLGMTMKNRTIDITTPEWIYSFNLEEGTGTKSINPQKLMAEEFNKLSSEDKKIVTQNAEELGSNIMSGMSGSVEKNAKEILGYQCDRATMMGSTVYSIHETPIALHSETNIMGVSVKSIATGLDTGSVPDKYFEFPEGITPEASPEGDQMAHMISEQTIAMLKDPEGYKQSSQGNLMIPPAKQQEFSEEEQMQMQDAMKALKGLFGN